MFRIDGPGATQDNKFTEGDPATGTRATVVSDEWLNAVQEELAKAIEDDGYDLDKLDPGQLSKLIRRRTIFVGSVAELEALSFPVGTNAYLTDEGRFGDFVFRAGDFSAEVTADSRQGIYIAPSGQTGSQGAWVRELNQGYVTPGMFGAKGNDSVNDTLAIKAAVSMYRNVFLIPPVNGTTYLFDNTTPLSFPPNTKFSLFPGVRVLVTTSNSFADSTGADNVLVEGLGHIEGVGAAGGGSLLQFTDSDRVRVNYLEISKSSSMGLRLINCTNSNGVGVNSHNNYFYGLEDKLGTNNHYTKMSLNSNGITGAVPDGTGGRGATLWMTENCSVTYSDASFNTEYGLRLYAETADTRATKANAMNFNYMEDNIRGDLIFYSEVNNLVQSKAIGNTIYRTVAPSLDVCFLVQGVDSVCKNNTIEAATLLAAKAYNLFDAVSPRISGGLVKNIGTVFGMSNTAVPSNSTIENITVENADRLVTNIPGAGHRFKNIRATSSGAVSDGFTIDQTMTGRCYIEDCHLDGFDKGVDLIVDNAPISLIRNTTVNSVTKGFNKEGSILDGLELRENDWDSASSIFLLAANMPKDRVSGFGGVRRVYATQSPSALTWAVGDECVNTSPAPGAASLWRCTTAGTPGTWTAQILN